MIVKENESIIARTNNQVPYISFKELEKLGIVEQGFSTKLGGVSKDKYGTMNLRLSSNDKKEDVEENFKRMADALGMDWERMVFANQTHTTNIHVVREEDIGKGLKKESDLHNIDGLITNLSNVPLVTFYADCVPLYFVDPVKKVIGLSHSGWRVTVGKMARRTVEKMQETYGSNPKDMVACIGPSICGSCYEVDESIADIVYLIFPRSIWGKIIKMKQNKKYEFNLWEANKQILLEAGLLEQNISTSNLCTMCNHDIFYSHRVEGEDRGGLAAFLMLK